MKKVMTFLAMLLVTGGVMSSQSSFGQGVTFHFSNLTFGLDAPVFNADGNRLAGTNYVAMLYGGPTVDSLQPAWDRNASTVMTPEPFTYMPLDQAGYFRYVGGYVTIGNVGCISTPWLQVRAWDARLGDTYEDVVQVDIGGYGESNLFQKRGGSTCGVPDPPERLLGLESFALREVIPEPGSTLLLLLGLPALLFFRRRRRSP